jgi:hypothetical protein
MWRNPGDQGAILLDVEHAAVLNQGVPLGFNVISRGIKTKQAAAKRFIKTGKGDLNYGSSGATRIYVYPP